MEDDLNLIFLNGRQPQKKYKKIHDLIIFFEKLEWPPQKNERWPKKKTKKNGRRPKKKIEDTLKKNKKIRQPNIFFEKLEWPPQKNGRWPQKKWKKMEDDLKINKK